MNRRLLPLNSLRAFEATGVHHSITKAAEALSVTQSAVSRHVINLEDILGIKLFDRLPHGLELTEHGKALLPILTQAFDALENKLDELVREEEVLKLHVSFPPSFAHYEAVPLLSQFQAENNDITIQLETPRSFGDLRKENVDVAVIYSAPQVTEYVMDLLWQETVTPLCHPSLLQDADFSNPQTFLMAQEPVHIKVANEPHLTWDNWLRAQGMTFNTHKGPVFDTAHLAGQYIMNGSGVLLSDPKLFEREIASEQLNVPFPELSRESGYGYYLVCRPEDMNHLGVPRFRDWLIQQFADQDDFDH